MTVKVFISYSHKDKKFFDRLQVHLAPLKQGESIKVWCDEDMLGGDGLSAEILKELANSDILLSLISADYLASGACMDELKYAQGNSKRVIPIILKRCNWDMENLKLKDTLAFPKDAKPIEEWDNEEEVFSDVVKGIARVVKELEESKIRKISPEIYQAYITRDETKLEKFAKELKIAKDILSSFYENIGESKKPIEEWGKDLANLIAQHKALQAQVKELEKETNSSNYNTSLMHDVQKFIDAGKVDKADELMNEFLSKLSSTDNEQGNERDKQVIEKANLLEMAGNIKSLKFDYESSAKCMEQAFDTLENDLPNSSKTTEIKEKIIWLAKISGEVYHFYGSHSKAKDCLTKALYLAPKYLHDDSLIIAELYSDAAMTHLEEKNYDEAEKYARKSVKKTEKILGDKDSRFAHALNGLAIVLMYQEKNEEAKEISEKAIKIIENSSPVEYEFLVFGLVGLVNLYVTLKYYSKAEKIIKEAIDITEKFIGKDSLPMCSCLICLGGFYRIRERYIKAEETLLQALEIAHKVAGPQSFLAIDIQENLEVVKRDRQQKSQRKKMKKGRRPARDTSHGGTENL